MTSPNEKFPGKNLYPKKIHNNIAIKKSAYILKNKLVGELVSAEICTKSSISVWITVNGE